MDEEITAEDRAIWDKLNETYFAALMAQGDFGAEGVNRKALVLNGLRTGHPMLAFYAAEMLKPEEKLELFDVWVDWAAFSEGYVIPIREIIKSLPRDWVLERIEAVAYPILDGPEADDQSYNLMLGLFEELDSDLATRLAKKALESDDEHVRDVGQYFLANVEQ